MYRLVYHQKQRGQPLSIVNTAVQNWPALLHEPQTALSMRSDTDVLAMEQVEKIPTTSLIRLDDSDIWASVGEQLMTSRAMRFSKTGATAIATARTAQRTSLYAIEGN